MNRTLRLAVPVFFLAAGSLRPQAVVHLTLNECLARGLAANRARESAALNRDGLAITSDVLDARITFLKARLAHVQAGYDSAIARLTFLRRQGLSWPATTP